jgi:AraC-like DNA-binding protein
MKKRNIAVQVQHYVMTVTDEVLAGLNVGTLAYLFKIERSKLSKQFKRLTHMTLEDFLFREKMGRAAYLLTSDGDGLTVKEISERIGYCTCDYFIRKFKQFYGIAPGSYRDLKSLYYHAVEREERSANRFEDH